MHNTDNALGEQQKLVWGAGNLIHYEQLCLMYWAYREEN